MIRALVSHFESILDNRRLFMGIAIVMVVLYHSMGTYDNGVVRMLFYPGFLGVDIFLLLSGYGLCNSYNKNSLRTFYKHRITRLAPLFLFLALSVTIIRTHIECQDLTLWDLLCNISTLSFWGVGGWVIEWYLCFSLYLGAVFPLLHKLLKRYWSKHTLYIVILLTAIILAMPIEWHYKCALGRIPIFCIGILLYEKKIEYNQILGAYLLGGILAFVLYVFHKVDTFVVFYMMAPFVMLLIAIFVDKVLQHLVKIVAILELLGTKTLEIYVANVILLSFVNTFHIVHFHWLVYFSLQCMLSVVVIWINKFINRFI